MTYAVAGIVLALGGALVGFSRVRRPGDSFAAEVYHMSARSHRRFALASAFFAAVFAGDALWGARLAVPALGVYLLLLILYGASFLRGATGEDE